ncbi:MAG: hypothetical protein ACHRXM_01865 [Isosphaerales bacterium]
MKTIHAVWQNGQIVPTQPVDWPEGTALAVEPIEDLRPVFPAVRNAQKHLAREIPARPSAACRNELQIQDERFLKTTRESCSENRITRNRRAEK